MLAALTLNMFCWNWKIRIISYDSLTIHCFLTNLFPNMADGFYLHAARMCFPCGKGIWLRPNVQSFVLSICAEYSPTEVRTMPMVDIFALPGFWPEFNDEPSWLYTHHPIETSNRALIMWIIWLPAHNKASIFLSLTDVDIMDHDYDSSHLHNPPCWDLKWIWMEGVDLCYWVVTAVVGSVYYNRPMRNQN